MALVEEADLDGERRRELAAFLRSARERLRPEEVGLRRSARRRAKGLLREETAAAAGISATWYTWLEQGREVRASPRAIEGLARALKLDSLGRAYLFRLARPDLQPPAEPGSRAPSPGLAMLIAGLGTTPAYVLDPAWNVVLANEAATVLLGRFDAADPWSGNLLARMFTDARWQTLFAEWDDIARLCVGQFRAASAGRSGVPAHDKLVASLLRVSPEFAALWGARQLAQPRQWTKLVVHPQAGRLSFVFSTLRPDGEDGMYRVCLYAPADAESAARWQRHLDQRQDAAGQRT